MNNPVSRKTLLIATLFAIIFALVIYFIVVLPAEYNKDPTGLGEKLGLMVLSNSNETNDVDIAKETVSETIHVMREDEVLVVVPPHKGVEYKFSLEKYGRLIFQWQTIDESNIYFDFHGEPRGDTTGFFESYSISTAKQAKGTATVPFSGSHGWYWKNTTDMEMTIKLTTSGNYTVIGLK